MSEVLQALLVTVAPHSKPFDIKVKRFAITDLAFTITCPHCLNTFVYKPDYFSYPTANTPEKHEIGCSHCERELYFYAQINVSVTISAREALGASQC